MDFIFYISIASLLLWIIITLLPWRPWFTTEKWDENDKTPVQNEDLSDVTVLIPARNEEKVLGITLEALSKQGNNLNVIVIDDNSDDNTAEVAQSVKGINTKVISNKPLEPGWSGKLWALENGRAYVDTPLTMLLDADIKIKPKVITGLRDKLQQTEYSFVSLMAQPSLSGFWERLLMPAFIYFFKMLYPFRLANSDNRWVSAAAGGCILLESKILNDIGGFAALKETLIDDCTLAKKVNEAGYKTWLGLTHSVQSIRPYDGIKEIWNMVARTAYTQLQYSVLMLLLCTVLMIIAYVIPVVGLFYFLSEIFYISIAALLLMAITYLPTILFYKLSPIRAFTMPYVGALFLAMTWTSAFRYWRGERMRWRGRVVTE